MGEPISVNGHYRNNTAVMYSHGPFSSKRASPPTPSFRSDIFGQNGHSSSAQSYATSPTAERHSADRNGLMPSLSASTSDPISFARDARGLPAVLIRRLPRSIGPEALKSLLIFAEDLVETELVRTSYPEDQGFATAVARFNSSQGAMEVQHKLHGKPNSANDANMLVELHNIGPAYAYERRNTIDGTASRTQTSSASSGRSRFNSAFHSTNESVSPPLPTSSSSGNADFPTPENSLRFQNLFSPQSPLANGVDGSARISGKSTINEDDNVDDETGELLKDPIAYARSGQHPAQRRATNPAIPVTRFGSLSLNSSNGHSNGLASPISNGFPTPRGNGSISMVSGQNGGPNGFYGQDFSRVPPAINPADQNPPCNTLYVGNLPMDTSEDELKALFSKQRGYKRLCFRTKANGPMCFVEFEDVSFATQTLNKLYGHVLHNSVKGGIRLSFSKNPLGVRNNQPNGMSHNTMSPQAMAPGYGGVMNGGNFSAVSGPPPGLSGPPGLPNGGGYRGLPTGMDGMFSNAFNLTNQEFVNQLGPRNYSGGVPQPLGTGTFGREPRGYPDAQGYSDYANGR